MIKKFFLSFSFLLFSYTLIFSQDLIITSEDEIINCRITRVTKEYVYFTFKLDNEYRSTLIPVLEIKHYEYNYFSNSEVPEEKVIGFKDFKTFVIGANVGYSYQLAKIGEDIPEDFKNYIKELKSGFHYGGFFTYYVSENRGIGLNSYFFNTSNSLSSIYAEDSKGNRTYGSMSHDLTISFIGFASSYRFINYYHSNTLIINLSIGYMEYSSDIVIIDDYKMTGNTSGISLNIGYDVRIAENISLGFNINYISGKLFNYYWDDAITKDLIKLDTPEGLNRLDFSIGLRF